MFVPLIGVRKAGGGPGSGVRLEKGKIAKRTSVSLLDRDL